MECEEKTTDGTGGLAEMDTFGDKADKGSEACGDGRAPRPGIRDEGAFFGCYVGRDPSNADSFSLGKVISFDSGTGMYQVLFEGGHLEEMGHQEVSQILFPEDRGSGMKLSCRKRKLDLLVPSAGDYNVPRMRQRKDALDGTKGSSENRSALSNLHRDADSCTDSCDSTQATASTSSAAQVRAPQLPPSSGGLGIPEESVSYLFSVYSFLRSFSHLLFLSPFGLDDFIGSLCCKVQNTLLDVIHVSLMRALRRHLEALSSEGSVLALKCLRHCDWPLLDSLTWPVFLVEYLYVMKHMKQLAEEGFGIRVLSSDYYGLSEATKLKVLQILSDDIMDSAELRTELEMREDMDEENESISSSNLPLETGPRRVHPRYSKTSAYKDAEALKYFVEPEQPDMSAKDTKAEVVGSAAASDGNNDECRLCGMDGNLICCDGCPSAYHSRCIGLSKAFLPEGSWFCPECKVSKIGPTCSRVGREVSGAEIFGVDPYERVFLGTCKFLLVLGTSLNGEPFSRYYNQDDVVKVLMAIHSAGEITSMYADICEGISKYWELPLYAIPFGRMGTQPSPHQPSMGFVPLSDASKKKVSGVFDNRGENHVSNVTDSSAVDRVTVTLCQKDDCLEGGVSGSGLDFMDQSCSWDPQKYDAVIDDMSGKVTLDVPKEILPLKDERLAERNATLTRQNVSPLIHRKVQVQAGNESGLTEIYESNQRSGSSAPSGTCISANNGTSREDTSSSIFPAQNETVRIAYDSKGGSHAYGDKSRIGSYRSSYVISDFKLHGYTNQYVQGDVAASAAANLAIVVSEESRVSESRASSNPRKTVAADIAQQINAFSGATFHFSWPNYEKKLMDVPREKCGWCIACKGATTTKKGCFLNLVAANAIKGFARNSSGLRPMKHDASQLSAIAMHMLHMKDGLHGLLMGQLLDAEYTRQWHEQLKKASNCTVLKFLLLELEKNIRTVALSGNWIKLVDETLDLSAASTAATFSGTNKKRGPGGRKNKKQAVAPETLSNSSDERWNWWRGSKLSRYIFQKWTIPSSLVKKAARQGGWRRVDGICYPESSELPKRNRQHAWRASVEMCKSASQLALQVRRLDSNVRWRDLVRPDQALLDGKGSNVDGFVFRNAEICEKKIAQNKTIYALKFPNQKHLPLRVTKNILEAEMTPEEHGKLWFSEMHIPLYLIKDYEEKAGIGTLQPGKLGCVPKFRKRQLKACQIDIFKSLLHKGEKPSVSSCVSCKQDALLRDAVRCNSCEGYCHKNCALSSSAGKIDDVKFLFTCKPCYRAQASAGKEKRGDMRSCQPASRQGHPEPYTDSILQTACHSAALPSGRAVVHPEIRLSASSGNSGQTAKRVTYGLIWKRRKGDDSGKDFRLENIILKSRECIVTSRKPTCSLCKMPYRSDLMYIRCQNCANWFHADAVQLEEAQIHNLIGFKCHKCRRKSSLHCPYADPNYMKLDVLPLNEGMQERNEYTACKLPKAAVTPTPFSHPKVDNMNDDPLMDSLGRVYSILLHTPETAVHSNISESMSQGQSPSVRRPQVRPEVDASELYAAQGAHCSLTVNSQSAQKLPIRRNNANHGIYAKEVPRLDGPNINSGKVSSPQVQCEFPKPAGGVVISSLDFDHDCGNTDSMEYEPQTYFSFTELLASEDGKPENLCDLTMDGAEIRCPSSGCDDSEIMYSEGPPGSSSEHAEVLVDDPGICVGLACQSCKQDEPSPDLMCEVCGMCIHSHCSPWVESEIYSGGSGWRCGWCREWR